MAYHKGPDPAAPPLTAPLIVVVDGFSVPSLVIPSEPYGKFVGDLLATMPITQSPWTAYQVATTDPDVAIISVEAHLEKLEKQQQSKGQEAP